MSLSRVYCLIALIFYRKCQKPLKPKVTVQIASDTGQNKESVLPVPIHGAKMCDSYTILIAHGNSIYMSFEKIVSTLHSLTEDQSTELVAVASDVTCHQSWQLQRVPPKTK